MRSASAWAGCTPDNIRAQASALGMPPLTVSGSLWFNTST
jgi:hypothetical protein